MSLGIFLKRIYILLHNPAFMQSSLISIIIVLSVLVSFSFVSLFDLSSSIITSNFHYAFLFCFRSTYLCTYTHPSLSLIFFGHYHRLNLNFVDFNVRIFQRYQIINLKQNIPEGTI
jgi:hypothetical protein